MLSDLPATWRTRADELEPYAPAAAEAFRQAAIELDAAQHEAEAELLPPAESSMASGYSPRRLRELDAAGRLKNHGRKGAPLYRRGDLPSKTKPTRATGYDVQADADDLVSRMAP